MSKVGKTLREWNAQKGDVFYYHGCNTRGKPRVFDKFTSDGPVDDVGNGMYDDEYWHLVSRATPEPDYNDGKWHVHNGGECPLHPKTIVDITWYDGIKYRNVTPQIYDWFLPLMFRVVTPYVEPREGYICATIFKTAREAKIAYPGCNPIHVREVIEND